MTVRNTKTQDIFIGDYNLAEATAIYQNSYFSKKGNVKMNYESFKNAAVIKDILEKKPQYRECLFSRGYLITKDENISLSDYPFYSLWNSEKVSGFDVIVHKDQDYTVYSEKEEKLVLIGHAYNPFNGVYYEKELLKQAAEAYEKSRDEFFECINDWTGIFVVFVFDGDRVIGVQDCSGIKALYYGNIEGNVCFTSHPQLVADIYSLKMDPFVKKLVTNRFYNIGNRYLPGDLSPFSELKRIGANVYLEYFADNFEIKRFYPVKPLELCKTQEEYELGIKKAYEILHKNIELASEKWESCAISLSGGTDSKTTLACANGLYDRFQFFSFQSKDTEITDSEAAHAICEKLGLKHNVYPIPAENSEIEDFDELKAIIIHSYGYVRGLADNEIRKHICMYRWHYFDTEIKSWISEIVRVFFERKYGMKFPDRLTPRHFSILQTRYFASPSLLRKSDKIYGEYMKKFDLEKPKFNFEHTDLYYWEVRMSSWGMMVTQSLDLCHRITFPFNNRRLVELMLTLPREYRKSDKAHQDIIKYANKEIYDADIHILNNYFHSGRIMLEKIYFKYRTFLKK